MKKRKPTTARRVPIRNIIQPVMKLRMKLDRIINVTLQKKMGFGISQFRILVGLELRPEMSQKDIADFWDITEASVSRQVSILEKSGLVTRAPRIAITALGTGTVAKARTAVDIVFENIFKNITDKKRAAAAELLEELIKNI